MLLQEFLLDRATPFTDLAEHPANSLVNEVMRIVAQQTGQLAAYWPGSVLKKRLTATARDGSANPFIS